MLNFFISKVGAQTRFYNVFNHFLKPIFLLKTLQKDPITLSPFDLTWKQFKEDFKLHDLLNQYFNTICK